MKDWWKTYFDRIYLNTYKLRGQFKHTKQEVNFLEKIVPLKKHHKILDLCCGHGRHSIELAKRGYQVTGLDYSAYELDIARKEAKKYNLTIKLAEGDARNFKFKKNFDVIINMFTAFGYGSRADDKRILLNVGRNLNKNGKFLIDILNLSWLWRNYEPYGKEKSGKFFIKYKRYFDFIENINYENKTILEGNRRYAYISKNRLYSLSELKELLVQASLKIIDVYGSFTGKTYGLNTRRMTILSKKI